MADLKSVLKKLNKGKRDEDKTEILGETSLIRGTISTGSPYIDYVTGGGFLDGGYNTVEGSGGAGKSSIALLACKDVIERKKKYAVYFDGEGTLNDSYIDRMGVDRNMLIVKRGRNLETMLDEAEAFSTADDVGLIVLDSIPIFTSTTVEEKSASDNNMAVEARRYTARMPIIEGNCMHRGIGIIGLTSYKTDPGALGDNRVLPRGKWQITMNNTFLQITRKTFILDENKREIGHKLDIRVKKTKNGAYDPKRAYQVDFYYDGGFNQINEYARLFIELGVVNQSGGWITYPTRNSEDGKVNGTDAFIEVLKEDEDTFNFLSDQI